MIAKLIPQDKFITSIDVNHVFKEFRNLYEFFTLYQQKKLWKHLLELASITMASKNLVINYTKGHSSNIINHLSQSCA